MYVTFQKKKKLLVYNFSHSFDHYLSFQFFNGTFIRMVMPPAPRLFYNQRSGSCNGNPKPLSDFFQFIHMDSKTKWKHNNFAPRNITS